MSFSVGSTGALMVMILIALWIWRRGERPIRSVALNVALIAMVVGACLDSAAPPIAVKSFGDRDSGCWLWALVALNGGVHALSLGAFVKFILATIAPARVAAPAKPE